MDHTKRNTMIRCIIFLIIVGLLVFYLTRVFAFPDSEGSKQVFNAFYSEEENTLDGVYLGASSTYRYWVAPLAYEQQGFAITSLATAGQTLTLSRYLMEEVEKTQNPDIFVIELRSAFKDASDMSDALIRRVTDSMKQSVTRLQAIDYSLEYAAHGENDVTEKIDYYIPIVKYHDRWKGDLTKDDIVLTRTENQHKGFLVNGLSFKQKKCKTSKFTDERMPLDPYTEQIVVDLLDYCDTLDAEVLFVLSPFSATKEQLEKLNTTFDLIKERGYPVLDFNAEEMIREVGINFNTDFYNPRHTNCMGAEKYTSWLAQYIADNYDLEDHRGDAAYESWDESYRGYAEGVKEGKKKMAVE